MEGKPDPRQGGDVETPGTDDEVINDPLTHDEKEAPHPDFEPRKPQ
ncbi:MAG: hypothetical protein ABR511_07460 [Acidimicrobiales bacterium]